VILNYIVDISMWADPSVLPGFTLV